MKYAVVNVRSIGILLWVVFGIVSTIFAQDSKISSEEFASVRSTYKDLLAKEPYRIRYTHETFSSMDSKQPEETRLWMTEFAPPDREHNYYGLNATDPSRKYERIVIGTRIFTNKDGSWKELTPTEGGMGLGSGASSVEYFIRGSEKLGNVTTTVYEVVTGSQFARSNGPWQTSYYRSRYWMSKDGRILKYVGESDALITKRSRTTEIYEYDSKIKIEAPIK
jgi:hypothetical protein